MKAELFIIKTRVMFNDLSPELREFLNRYIGPDQTELVNYLVSNDDDCNILEQKTLHNYSYFSVLLKDGPFRGTRDEITAKMILVEDQIEVLQNLHNKLRRSKKKHFEELSNILHQIDALREEYSKLDNAEYCPRSIDLWVVIPSWMAEVLISKDMAIVQAYGQTWWGLEGFTEQPKGQ